jgi:hypothetical protein
MTFADSEMIVQNWRQCSNDQREWANPTNSGGHIFYNIHLFWILIKAIIEFNGLVSPTVLTEYKTVDLTDSPKVWKRSADWLPSAEDHMWLNWCDYCLERILQAILSLEMKFFMTASIILDFFSNKQWSEGRATLAKALLAMIWISE